MHLIFQTIVEKGKMKRKDQVVNPINTNILIVKHNEL